LYLLAASATFHLELIHFRQSQMSSRKDGAAGRPERFHGAFTGGFSAGYYNTAGSAEGWQPATFSSSRGRADGAARVEQRPEDFMDAEDGLLGSSLHAAEEFDTLGASSAAAGKRHAESAARGSAIPGPLPSELIAPASDPVGKRLLRVMGWRDGQGIGPRIHKKRRRNRFAEAGSDDDDNGQGDVPSSVRSRFAGGVVTYARDNAAAVIAVPPPKTDSYGLGFDPFKDAPEFALAASSSSRQLALRNGSGAQSTTSGVYRIEDAVRGGGVSGEGDRGGSGSGGQQMVVAHKARGTYDHVSTQIYKR
jgi:G patch domain-containing protein 1